MKYIITGGAGNISKPLALQLLAANHQVTVLGRSEANLKELIDAGATAAIGSVEDVDFLTKTFAGADAVYTMAPPKLDAANWKAFIGTIGSNYAKAIKASAVKKVVNLSSIGAHMQEGCGPVSGLFFVEKALNELSDVAIKHLRPGFFYTNFLGNIGMIKNMQIIGGNYGEGSLLPLANPADIASAAAEELLSLSFEGHSVRYVISDEKTTNEVASILGAAIGNPALPWVNFTDEQTYAGMLQAGLPDEVAKNYTEMGAAMRTGEMGKEYNQVPKPAFGKTKLEDFAKTFAWIYNS